MLRRVGPGAGICFLVLVLVSEVLKADSPSPTRRGSSRPAAACGRVAPVTDSHCKVSSEEVLVPLYMDVHSMEGGVTAKDVADAHMKDVEVQGQYGVDYKQYWVDEKAGKIFCLVEAPDADTANRVHREAHGLVADEIYEVQQG
jgi:hypothetical protein